MPEQVDFVPLLLVSLLAVGVPLALHRIPGVSLPIVVGEIVAGMVVGQSGLNLLGGHNPFLDFLKAFGFAYLMFLSGLEIDFELMGGGGRAREGRLASLLGSPLRAAALFFGLTLALSLLLSRGLARAGLVEDAFVLALILSTTSLGVVMPILKERGLARAEIGQHILVASVVADLATISLIGLYVIYLARGLSPDLFHLLVLAAVTVLVYRLARVGRRHLPLERLVEELSHATGQLDLRGALALMLVFVALAQELGVELILGAFLAGAIVALLSEEEAVLRRKLEAIGYGFFVPIFFIMAGAQFDLAALLGSRSGIILLPLLLVLAFLVKLLPALLYRAVFSWREALAVGAITSARLSLIIAAAAIGLELGVIDEAVHAAILLVAIATVVVAPLGFNHLLPAGEARPRKRVVVVGAPRHARLLAQRLAQHGEEVVLLTDSPLHARETAALGLQVVEATDGLERGMAQAGAGQARVIVCMLEDDAQSLRVAERARKEFAVEEVVARIRSPEQLESFRQAGVKVVDPSLSTVIMLESLVRHPHAFALVTEAAQEREVLEVRVGNPQVEGRPLRELTLPGDATILVLEREGEILVPRGYTRMRRGDGVTLVGSAGDVREAAAHLRG